MSAIDAGTSLRRRAAWRAICTRVATVACIGLLVGCAQAPCPPFRAAWYLEKSEAQRPTIYLAVLNEGTQPMPLERIVLNPAEPGAQGQVVYSSTTVPPETLLPGRLLLVNLDGSLDECHLPVAVQLQCGERRSDTQPVAGRLPNYLHQRWIDQCTRPRQAGSDAGTSAPQR